MASLMILGILHTWRTQGITTRATTLVTILVTIRDIQTPDITIQDTLTVVSSPVITSPECQTECIPLTSPPMDILLMVHTALDTLVPTRDMLDTLNR
jgi:hypothetical protein